MAGRPYERALLHHEGVVVEGRRCPGQMAELSVRLGREHRAVFRRAVVHGDPSPIRALASLVLCAYVPAKQHAGQQHVAHPAWVLGGAPRVQLLVQGAQCATRRRVVCAGGEWL